LVLAFHFAVNLRMVGSSEAGFNTKVLVKGSYETGSKLQATIREDLLQNSVKAKYIRVVDISSALSCKVRFIKHEVALIQIVVDVNADRIETI
jgi:hypothetical protein